MALPLRERGRAWRLAIDTRRAPAVAIKKAFAKGASIAVVRYERRGERAECILLGESSISGVGHLSTAMLDRCVMHEGVAGTCEEKSSEFDLKALCRIRNKKSYRRKIH